MRRDVSRVKDGVAFVLLRRPEKPKHRIVRGFQGKEVIVSLLARTVSYTFPHFPRTRTSETTFVHLIASCDLLIHGLLDSLVVAFLAAAVRSNRGLRTAIIRMLVFHRSTSALPVHGAPCEVGILHPLAPQKRPALVRRMTSAEGEVRPERMRDHTHLTESTRHAQIQREQPAVDLLGISKAGLGHERENTGLRVVS